MHYSADAAFKLSEFSWFKKLTVIADFEIDFLKTAIKNISFMEGDLSLSHMTVIALTHVKLLLFLNSSNLIQKTARYL